MYDFEALVKEVLERKPELSREELMRKIEEKRNTVGAGYLTSQGALFLVAGDYGIQLQQAGSSDLSLKDLHIGANDVTVVARVLAIYPLATFSKKDGGEGSYRRLVLFDAGRAVRLTVWEENLADLDKLRLEVGSPVRIVNGYVKQGLDGKPTLNLGRRGKLVLLEGPQAVAKLATLDSAAEELSVLNEERQIVALDCVVASEPRYSEFERSDGSGGSLFQFGVTGRGRKEEYRVVIWSPSEQPQLAPGQKLRITNVRLKRSSRGEMEVHGDAGSSLIVSGQVEKTTIAKPKESVLARVCSVTPTPKGSMILVVDKDKKVKVVDTIANVDPSFAGTVVRLSPEKASGDRLTCNLPDSLRLGVKEPFPQMEDLATKVNDARDESALFLVEVIALSHGSAEDVSLKDGTVVKKGELVVGDDTSEARLVGWRDQSEKLSGIQPGERLRLVGVTPRATRMGSVSLQISGVTAVERIRSR